MAQDGRAGGGRFHGEVDRCYREGQVWTTITTTTACSRMLEERGEKDHGEDSSLVIVFSHR